ncbi:MAG: putative DNA-binding domain-containing protein [Gammaproteobacteria bacterium]|nr:putative DNA-binding domain-containing protein [Gammaproteobacteria bacterium]MBT8150581.1 putative DNA-binding domain-containing protein [Gammaproteobacteria bacterium]NNM12257.1 DUF2063 domain-containing protein [Pseudomonadales bacterium]RZV49987.1 MAG: DUF2063 domain-containing protein [Pseudomonadales bacterium]
MNDSVTSLDKGSPEDTGIGAAIDDRAPPGLVAAQRRFAAHLRDPRNVPAPASIEPRRMRVYTGLVYANIESFLSSGFPVLRKLHTEEEWVACVRTFIAKHCSHTPYFTNIGAEFVEFLGSGFAAGGASRPYLLELAQYEWAELALFLSDESLPASLGPAPEAQAMLAMLPRLSPLAWPMVFHYAVHEIGPGNEPCAPEAAPVCLVVYRDAQDEVKFLRTDLFSARLLELIEGQPLCTAQLVEQLAGEAYQMTKSQLQSGVCGVLANLYEQDIIRFADCE